MKHIVKILMRKKLVSREMTNVTLTEYKNLCNSNIIYILFAIFLIISISICSVFIYFHWYQKRKPIEKIYWMQFFKNTIPFNIYMGNIKQINIKNRTYYFYNDMINVENFDPNLLKIDKK